MIDNSTRPIEIARVNRKNKKLFIKLSVSFLVIQGFLILVLSKYLWISVLILLSFLFSGYKLRSLYRKLSDITVQGDSVIISSASRNQITSLNSVKRIRTRKLGSTKFTTLTYQLDGMDQLATTLTSIEESPGSLIKSYQTKRKNKKANL